MEKLLQFTLASVHGKYVTTCGIRVLKHTDVIQGIDELVETFNIDSNQSDETILAEFAARITYCSWPKGAYDPIQYHAKLQGHSGVYELKETAILIAGCSIECILELVSNRSNRSCRVTSSRTKAMRDTYYACSNPIMIPWINKFLELRAEFLTTNSTMELETLNQYNLCSKAGAILISMNNHEWKQLIDGRLSPNSHCEEEYRNLLMRIREII